MRLKLPEIKKDEFNEEVYQNMIDYLSDEKLPIIEEIEQFVMGQVVLPTGTGKSIVQQMSLVRDIRDKFPLRASYLIASHRLLLNKQLLLKISGALEDLGVKFNVLFVGSGSESKEEFAKFYEDKDVSFIVDAMFTTDPNKIEEFKKKTEEADKFLLIVSTYNSIHKLCSTDIDIALFDEAHMSTTPEFTQNLKYVLPACKKKYFFTASRKVVDINRGMNDKNIYGEILVSMTNREAIDRHLIVQPKMHFVNASESKSWLEMTLNQKIEFVISCFNNHKRQIDSESYDPKSQGAKLLFTLNNQKDIMRIMTSEKFKEYCGIWNIKTLGVCSDHKYIDGEPVSDIDIEKGIASVNNKDDMILFHIRMLSEGIDIPSLTGVVIVNHKELSTMSQIVGRCLRLNSTDRKNILNGTYTHETAVKPYAYVIMPLFIDEVDMKHMTEVVKMLYEDYCISEEFIVQNDEYCRKAFEDIDPQDDDRRGCDEQKLNGVYHLFEELQFVDKEQLLLEELKSYYQKKEELELDINRLELQLQNL